MDVEFACVLKNKNTGFVGEISQFELESNFNFGKTLQNQVSEFFRQAKSGQTEASYCAF